MRLFFLLSISILIASCTHMTKLSEERISGKKNFIFVRPFAVENAPPEVGKLTSGKFFAQLESQDFFSGRDGKTYSFDFYMGQPCPTGYTCYYITGSVMDFEYQTGCCGNDGVEARTNIKFWNDITKTPLFEISEWNNEIFEPEDTSRLDAMEMLAEDTAQTLVDALLKELSRN
ncbi:MAG: hypothetical protein IMF07_07000 [Proteobacteria bacterium]|nr:hypothetical protein [Pseudomonadota bacterium]